MKAIRSKLKGPVVIGTLVLGTAASALYLWIALRGTHPTGIVDRLARADVGIVAGAIALSALTIVLRAMRVSLLLGRPASDLPGSLPSIMAGYLGNLLLPMQAGELARVVVGDRFCAIRPAMMVAAMAIERTADLAMALAGLAVAVLLVPGLASAWFATGAIALAMTAAGLLVIVAARRRPEAVMRLGDRIGARLPGFLGTRVAQAIRGLCEGMGAMRGAASLAAFFALTLGIWLSVCVTIACSLAATDVSAPVRAIVLLNSLLTLALVLPAAPGYVGTFQVAFVLGLGTVALDADASVPASVVFHLALLAAIALMSLFTALGVLRRAPTPPGGPGATR